MFEWNLKTFLVSVWYWCSKNLLSRFVLKQDVSKYFHQDLVHWDQHWDVSTFSVLKIIFWINMGFLDQGLDGLLPEILLQSRQWNKTVLPFLSLWLSKSLSKLPLRIFPISWARNWSNSEMISPLTIITSHTIWLIVWFHTKWFVQYYS